MISQGSKFGSVVPLAVAVGLMLSPESLVVLGNGAGTAGVSSLAFLVLAIGAHLLTTLSYRQVFSRYPGPEGEARFLRVAFGVLPATILPLCSRILFTICAATIILATAGYVFNEVFVYWFPNLGFSFSLLGLLLAINLLGRRYAEAAQIAFVSVAILGLAALSIAGLLGSVGGPQRAATAAASSGNLARAAFLGLFIFMGHELARFTGNSSEKQHRLLRPLVVGIMLVAAIFTVWGLVSLMYMPAERLAASTIPHSIAARAILGRTGRVIMGIVVLAGTSAAVNALLFAVSRMVSGMAAQGLLPRLLAGDSDQPRLALVLLALGIAAMMVLGMAGEPETEIYFRAALLLWLLTYAAVHLSVLVMRRRLTSLREPLRSSGHPATAIFGLVATLAGFVGLLVTDPNVTELVRFILRC